MVPWLAMGTGEAVYQFARRRAVVSMGTSPPAKVTIALGRSGTSAWPELEDLFLQRQSLRAGPDFSITPGVHQQ